MWMRPSPADRVTSYATTGGDSPAAPITVATNALGHADPRRRRPGQSRDHPRCARTAYVNNVTSGTVTPVVVTTHPW